MVYCDRVILLKQLLKDDDLSLYVILNALSCIRFILMLRLRLCNIHTNEQYPSCDSIKAFIIIIFLSACMKDARQTKALNFWHAVLQRLLIEIINVSVDSRLRF